MVLDRQPQERKVLLRWASYCNVMSGIGFTCNLFSCYLLDNPNIVKQQGVHIYDCADWYIVLIAHVPIHLPSFSNYWLLLCCLLGFNIDLAVFSFWQRRVSSERCAELTIIAATHGLKEVWISDQVFEFSL
jgi:hypothetical protein